MGLEMLTFWISWNEIFDARSDDWSSKTQMKLMRIIFKMYLDKKYENW